MILLLQGSIPDFLFGRKEHMESSAVVLLMNKKNEIVNGEMLNHTTTPFVTFTAHHGKLYFLLHLGAATAHLLQIARRMLYARLPNLVQLQWSLCHRPSAP